MQVVMSPTCLEVQGLAWTVSLSTGNVPNMQMSWRSIKLTDLDVRYLIWKKVSRNKEILRLIYISFVWSMDDNEWVLWNDIWYLGHFLSGNALKEMIDICLKWRVDVKFDLGCRAAE